MKRPGSAHGNTFLRKLAVAVFRHPRLFAVAVLSTLAVTLAATLLPRTQYTSEMQILVRSAHDEQINSELEILRSQDLADSAIDPDWHSADDRHSDSQIHMHDVAVTYFRERFAAERMPNSDVIRVVYSDTNARHAHEMLTRLRDSFLIKQREFEHPELSAAPSKPSPDVQSGMNASIFATPKKDPAPQQIAIVEQPTMPMEPVSRPWSTPLLGIAAAFLLGLCLALFLEESRDTIAAPRELEAISQRPVLATIPLLTSAERSQPFALLPQEQRKQVTVRRNAVIRRALETPAKTTGETTHWDSLRSLMTTMPAASSPLIAPRSWEIIGDAPANAQAVARVSVPASEPLPALETIPLLNTKPLLEPEAPRASTLITRSTAAQFPLRSVVPGAQVAAVAATPVAAKSAAVPAQPVIAQPAAPAPIARKEKPRTSEPVPMPAPASDTRKQQILREKLAEGWAETLSQRVLTTLGHRTARNSGSRAAVQPQKDQAEVAYNNQGKVDYVTYTFNAPPSKSRRRTVNED